MPLGKLSLERLSTCHPDLRGLIRAVADGVDRGDLAWAGVSDITVLCGYRGKAEQDAAVASGASKAPWPTSKHNRSPSDAVDVAPFPIDWQDREKFLALHAYVTGVARQMRIDLRHIDWDLPHIQRNVP